MIGLFPIKIVSGGIGDLDLGGLAYAFL